MLGGLLHQIVFNCILNNIQATGLYLAEVGASRYENVSIDSFHHRLPSLSILAKVPHGLKTE